MKRWTSALLLAVLPVVLVGPSARAEVCVVSGELVAVTVEIEVDGVWQDISADVRTRQPIKIRRGIQNEGARAAPGRATLQLNNGASNVQAGVSGRYSPRNPRSDLFGKIGRNSSIRISAGLEGGAQSIRFVGEVVQWPPRWDTSGNDRWVNLEAAGILRRMGIPGKPLRSAPHRWITRQSPAPIAAWSLTDGDAPGDPLIGGEPMRQIGDPGVRTFADWQVGSVGVWLPPTVRLSRKIGMFGTQLSADVDDDATSFVLDWLYRYESGASNHRATISGVTAAGDAISAIASVERSPSTAGEHLSVQIFEGLGGADLDVAADNTTAFDGLTHHFRLSMERSGGDYNVALYLDSDQVISDSATVSEYSPSIVSLTGSAPSSDDQGSVDVGWAMLWDFADAASVDAVRTALFGHTGEAAGRRIERLCSEESVAFTSTGDLDDTTAMGPQKPRQFLNLLDEAATADAAGSRLPILVEQRAALGLHMNTRKSFYITTI